jgi:hypothetical protein
MIYLKRLYLQEIALKLFGWVFNLRLDVFDKKLGKTYNLLKMISKHMFCPVSMCMLFPLEFSCRVLVIKNVVMSFFIMTNWIMT